MTAHPKDLGALLSLAAHSPDPTARAEAKALVESRTGLSDAVASLHQVVHGPQREPALRRIQHLGPALWPALAQHLAQTPRWSGQKAAAWALAQLGATKTLANALQNAPSEGVRAAAARGLGQCGHDGLLGLSALVARLSDPAWKVRQSAAITLGKLGPDALDALDALARCGTEDASTEVRRSAAWSLGRIGGAAPILARIAIRDTDANVRVSAVRTLVEVGADDDTIEALKDALPSEAAQYALQRLGLADPPPTTPITRLDDPLRVLTWALQDRKTVQAAVEALASSPEDAATEALAGLLDSQTHGDARAAAIAALAGRRHPAAKEAIRRGVASDRASVRIAAIAALTSDPDATPGPMMATVLRTDPSWRVRRAAFKVLIGGEDDQWRAVEALLDPLWRIRLVAADAVRTLIDDTPAFGVKVQSWLAEHAPQNPFAKDIALYLTFHTLQGPERQRWYAARPPWHWPPEPMEAAPWWDEDPPVARDRLTRLSDAEIDRDLPLMVHLLDHMDDGLAELAIDHLAQRAPAPLLAEGLAGFEDPRRPRGRCHRLLQGLTATRRANLARWLRSEATDPGPFALAWAIANTDAHNNTQDPDTTPTEAASLADHPAFWRSAALDEAPELRDRAAKIISSQAPDDPAWSDTLQALQTHWSPHTRAQSLTKTRARAVLDDPSLETSWDVLIQAARLLRYPIKSLAPRPERVEAVLQAPSPLPGPRVLREPAVQTVRRALGATGLSVSPVGFTGHYGLPEEGFRRVWEAGGNFFFWEPPYHGMTRFVRSLSPEQRRALVIVSGTMGHTYAEMRAELDHALRRLHLTCLPVFLVFWARSEARLGAEALDAVKRLKQEGLIGHYGFSTHRRGLALEALEDNWEVVMIRHNAAHRGVEQTLMPAIAERGVGLITFSNLCYGRMLTRPWSSGPAPPTAADCYRYSLAQPGVSACLSAPSTLAQLDENLTVFQDSGLSKEDIKKLRAFGDEVYLNHQIFVRHIRCR